MSRSTQGHLRDVEVMWRSYRGHIGVMLELCWSLLGSDQCHVGVMWRLCGGRGPWVQIVGNMPNLGYQCIFSCSINLEGSPLDPSDGMLQIAAYLQHICCTWQFLKNYECSKNETPDMVSFESDYTSYQIS